MFFFLFGDKCIKNTQQAPDFSPYTWVDLRFQVKDINWIKNLASQGNTIFWINFVNNKDFIQKIIQNYQRGERYMLDGPLCLGGLWLNILEEYLGQYKYLRCNKVPNCDSVSLECTKNCIHIQMILAWAKCHKNSSSFMWLDL